MMIDRRQIQRVLFILIVSILVVSAIDWSVEAATITVCEKGCDDTSIQSAIDHSQPSDTVEIHEGRYLENVLINKKVNLIGLHKGSKLPIIDADGKSSVVTISADGAKLTGFTLMNSGRCGCGHAGIRIKSNNNTIYGNNITKNRYGIYAENGTRGNIIFRNNFVSNADDAQDKGNNQWNSHASGNSLEVFVDFFKDRFSGQKKDTGNHYDNYDEAEEGCIAERGLCVSPKNISGGTNRDLYPLVSWDI